MAADQESHKGKPWVPLLRNYPFSDKVNAVSIGAETLYTRLLSQCDGHHNYVADPFELLCRLYPARFKAEQVSPGDLKTWLAELAKSRLVKIYKVGGSAYLHIINPKILGRSDREPRADFPLPADKPMTANRQSPACLDDNDKRVEEKRTPETEDAIEIGIEDSYLSGSETEEGEWIVPKTCAQEFILAAGLQINESEARCWWSAFEAMQAVPHPVVLKDMALVKAREVKAARGVKYPARVLTAWMKEALAKHGIEWGNGKAGTP